MHARTRAAAALALLAILGSGFVALASSAPSMQHDGVRALDGEWIFVEDRTEGRALEQLGAPMSSKFSMRVEEGAVILDGHGSGHRNVRVAIDGATTDVAEPKTTEFVLTELGKTRAVFDNPRHDYPKRIVYELSAEGGLIATTGYAKGGTPRRFEFKREGASR